MYFLTASTAMSAGKASARFYESMSRLKSDNRLLRGGTYPRVTLPASKALAPEVLNVPHSSLAENSYACSALHFVAAVGQTRCCAMLCESGADVDQSDKDGEALAVFMLCLKLFCNPA